jgi:hypothetical protein
MSPLPPLPADDLGFNPFAAPGAAIGARADDAGSDDEAESIRLAHIGHEASVRAVGLLYYLGGFFGLIVIVGLVISAVFAPPDAFGRAGPGGVSPRVILLGVGVFYAAMTALNLALGYGLRTLKVWARWTIVVLMGLTLLYCLLVGLFLLMVEPVTGLISLALGGGISGYIFYLMVSSKGAMVFSHRYQAIIAQTPHIRYRTSLLVKILLALVLAFIAVAIAMALFSSPR